jgi:16S rRNA (cytosine967-C5)-methyltransferase
VTDLEGFAEGAWWVQDAAAALPAQLLGAVAGLRVLDACAAPGGKTLQLAAAGAQVTALDASEPRLVRVRENLERMNLAAEVVCADARTWRPAAPFDAVLLDAPCTATGTLRRHPDAAWLRRPTDVPALAQITLMGRVLKGETIGAPDVLIPLFVCAVLAAVCVAFVARGLRAAALKVKR